MRKKGVCMSHPQRFQRTPLAAALGVALLPFVSSPVHAQLEEVVVTATKQEASLQDEAHRGSDSGMNLLMLFVVCC